MYFMEKISVLVVMLLCSFACVGKASDNGTTPSTVKPLTSTSAIHTAKYTTRVNATIIGVTVTPSISLPVSVSSRASVTKATGVSAPPSSSVFATSSTEVQVQSSTGVRAQSSTAKHDVKTTGNTLNTPFSTPRWDNASHHTASKYNWTTKHYTSVSVNTNTKASNAILRSSPGPTYLNSTDVTKTEITKNVTLNASLWPGLNISDKVTVTKNVVPTSKLHSVSAFSAVPFNGQNKTSHASERTPKTPPSKLPVSTTEVAVTSKAGLPDSVMETVMNSLLSGGSLGNLNKFLRDMNFVNQLFDRSQNTSETTSGISDVFREILFALPDLVDDNSTIGDDMRDILEGLGVAPNITEALSQLILDIQGLMSPESLLSDDQCIADISELLHGVGKTDMWAIQMLDASGKPGKSLLKGALKFWGNFDECMETSGTVVNSQTGLSHVIRGEYWQLGFSIPPTFIKLPDVVSDILPNGKLTWDVCLPVSCDKQHVMNATAKLPVDLIGFETLPPVRSPHRNWKNDPSAIVAVVFICLIVSLSVIGTLYDVISGELARRHRSDTDSDSESSIVGGYTSEVTITDDGRPSITRFSNGFSMVTLGSPKTGAELDDAESIVLRELGGGKRRDGFGRQLLLSFSISKNTEKILNTRTGESNLGCIHGIRVLSMAWVILGHALFDRITAGENITDYLEQMKNFTMQAMLNGTLSVDTFFLIGGVLLCYLLLRESKKSATGKPTIRQMVLYYVHRYWRLTPMYMFIIMMYAGLEKYLSDGPNDISSAASLHVDSDNCRRNWWANLLYINNLYNPSEMCMGWSWFLANDMQFYVIAPLATLPIAFGWSVLGIIVILIFLVIHIVTNGYIEWSLNGEGPLQSGNEDYMNKIYFTPWCRVGVFAIGLLMGYFLHKMKRPPKIPKYVLVLGWQVCLTIGLLCTYVTYSDWKDGTEDWPVNTRIVHETLYRPGWALFVSWIIFVCCAGHGGVINSILSWDAWIPLGRLTYGAYLIHPIVQAYARSTSRTLVYLNITSMSYDFLGSLVISYALAFITCALVEAPCMGLEKAVLAKLKIKK